jgi:hypothetical protein
MDDEIKNPENIAFKFENSVPFYLLNGSSYKKLWQQVAEKLAFVSSNRYPHGPQNK